MKKGIVFLFAAITVILFFACSKMDNVDEASIPCLPSNLKANVIAFYPFSGGSVNDFSGNGNHLSNPTSAVPATDRSGNSNCAYSFNANAKEYLTTTNTTFLNKLSDFSVSLWYQPLDTSQLGNKIETLVSRDSLIQCPDRSGQWSISLYDCRRAVFGHKNRVWDKLFTSSLDCKSEVIARTGSWHHMVATYNNNTQEMKIYRDNVLQETAIGTVVCAGFIPTVLNIGDLFVGHRYTGRIDDIILFNKSLNNTEVNQLFSLETCCSSGN